MGDWTRTDIVPTSGTATPQQPHGITLAEKSNSRTVINIDRTTYTVLTATIQEAVNPPAGYTLGIMLHLQLSSDGANWGDLGPFQTNRGTSSGGYYTTAINIPDVLVYSASQNWYVRTWAATANIDPGPSAALESAACSVPGLSLPLATGVGAVTFAGYSSESNPAAFPYNMTNSDGTQYWSIPSVTYDDTGCLDDSNAFFVRVTVQSLDSSKNPISAEKPYAGTQVTGGVQTCDPLMGGYGPDGSGLSSNNIAYVRFKYYVCNRVDRTASSFSNSACATLENAYTVAPTIGGQIIPNGNSVDVMVAQNGTVPSGQLDGSRVTLGTGSGLKQGANGLQFAYGANLGDDGSGNAVAKLATPLTTLNNLITLANQGISNSYLAPTSVLATNMGAGAVTQANGALAALAVVDSNVASVGISKLVSGTVIFTGDVYMSRGTGYPVMALGYAGLYLYGVASGSTGLTTYPYVVIQSGGIGLYSGGNEAVTLSSNALYLWSVNGNSSYPYMSLTSSGATIASGSFSTSISSSQIQNSYSGGASMTLNTAGLKILDGTYSVIVQSGLIQLWSVDGNSSYPCIGITSTTLYITAGSYSAQFTASQIQLSQSGGATLTLTNSSLTIQSGSYSLTASSSSLTLSNGSGVQLQMTSGTVTIQASSSNYVTISSAGTVTITAGGYSTTISGNSLGTGYVTCASVNITPGNLTLGVGSLGGTVIWPWQQVSSSASSGYITPPSTVQGFVTIMLNNGATNTAYKLGYYNV